MNYINYLSLADVHRVISLSKQGFQFYIGYKRYFHNQYIPYQGQLTLKAINETLAYYGEHNSFSCLATKIADQQGTEHFQII